MIVVVPIANKIDTPGGPIQKVAQAPRGRERRSPWSQFRTCCPILWGSNTTRNGVNALLVLITTSLTLVTAGMCQQSATPQTASPYLQSQMVKRLALVIGNQDYPQFDQTDQIPTAFADAKEVVNLLRESGFTTVRSVPDVSTKGELLSWAQELTNVAGSSDDPVIFFFYFAGHGFQSGAWPFLVPASVDPNALYDQSLGLNELIDLLSNHRRGVAIFVIDACRNVVSSTSNKTISASDADRSRSQLSATPAAAVTVIDLSTEYDTAANNSSPMSKDHSPYEWEFMQQARITQSLQAVFDEMKSSMHSDQHNYQVPVEIGEVNLQHLFLLPDAEEDALEATAWRDTLKTNRRRCVDLYTWDFPASPYLISALAWERDNQGGEDTYESCNVNRGHH